MADSLMTESYKESIIQNIFPKRTQDYSKLKVLYSTSDADCNCCMRWSEYADAADEEKEMQFKSQGHDVVHRMRRPRGKHQSSKPWETHSIVIRGQFARDLVENIWAGYPGLIYKPTELELRPPFKPVLHRWDKLKDYLEDRHKVGRPLLDLFRQSLVDHLAELEKIKSTRVCTFQSLWMILAPGELVLGQYHGVKTIFRLHDCELYELPQEPKYWHINARYADWNGSRCGFASQDVHTYEYKETRALDALEVLPLSLVESGYREFIQNECIARGRKFESLRGFHFMASRATKVVEETSWGGKTKFIKKPVSGRVIVDACAYYRCQDRAERVLRPFSGTTTETTRTQAKNSKHIKSRAHKEDESEYDSSEEEADVSDDSSVGSGSSSSRKLSGIDFENFRRNEDLTPLEEEHCMLACPCVKGFDLKSEEWCELFIDKLHEITWIDEMFEKLVLPAKRKELVLASVKHRNKASDMDFVPGKGQGLCALMFGPPGVGKTLTAEAIAEKSRLPLYLLNASDLGTNPREMEKSLSLALECCTLWKAILLLDEADIFLTTRSLENLERNELVSIFLRHLERYQGVLFLTTNRIQVLDPAFQSRVDIFLAYKDLDSSARKEVWKNLLARAGPDRVRVNDEELDVLAEIKLNGREIKSLMKSALLLDPEDVETVGLPELRALAEMRIEAQQILNPGSS